MASLPMGNSYHDQEAAIRDVGKGYDKIKQLQGLHQLKSSKGEEAIHLHELTESLIRGALQDLNHALCIMKSGVSKAEVKSEIVVIESGSLAYSSHQSVASYESNQRTKNGRSKRRRVGENSWINNTTMPYDDGYQWRKYGDKKITGSNFSRGYFRCTYKEKQGCQAQKLVQQTSNKEPPLFQVTYINKHTCNFHNTTPALSPPKPSPYGSIQQDNSINQILHLNESNPSMPQLLNHGSPLGDANLSEIFTSACMVERNCECDIDSFLRDLEGFSPDDCLLN